MVKPGPKAPAPTKPLDDKDFDRVVGLIRIQCTQDEICAVLNMSEQTLDLRLKERGYLNFRDCYARHGGEGRASLRRMQWKSAEAGVWPAQQWLGVQMLGQRQKSDVDNTSSDGSMSPVKTQDAVIAAIKRKYNDTD